MKCDHSNTKAQRGFTITELMVTVGIVAILGALALPSLGEFTTRNQLSSIGGEFSGSILKARNDAIGKNTCVTMCLSTTFDNARPVCSTSGDDWQVGWITFLNQSCNFGLNRPEDAVGNYSDDDLISVRRPASGEYYLTTQASGRRKLMFNSRGSPGLSAASEFDLVYRAANDPITLHHSFNICMDGLGRTRNIPSSSAC